MIVSEVDLAVLGMTCTSCAQRVQNRLNSLPGVTASVNYATEAARIEFSADYDVSDLMRTIAETG